MSKVKVFNNKGKFQVTVNHDIAGLANVLDNMFIKEGGEGNKPLEIGEAKRETHAVRFKKFLELKTEIDRKMADYQQQINALSNRFNEIRSEINSKVQENIRRIATIETENLVNLNRVIYFKSENSLIPEISEDTVVYEVTASSSYAEFKPFNVFNSLSKEWFTNGVTTNYWIQIKLPFAVRLWRILFAGREDDGSPSSVIITDDRNKKLFESSLNIHTKIQIIHFKQEIKSSLFKFFFPTSTAGAVNPGLSYIQLFGLLEQFIE